MPTVTRKSTAPKGAHTSKEVRLSIRTNPEQKELLRRAALSRNTDLSQFVLEASLASAQRVVADETVLVLSSADYLELARVMDESPAPNSALRALLEKKRVWDE